MNVNLMVMVMVVVMVMAMVMVMVIVSIFYNFKSVIKWAKTFQESLTILDSRRGMHSKTARKIDVCQKKMVGLFCTEYIG